MYNFCVFAGTTEGRELVEYLCARNVRVTACVATEYGQTLLPDTENLTVSAKRLPPPEIRALLTRERFDMVIDATHPYAASITESIFSACSDTGTEYCRLLRPSSEIPEDAVYAGSAAEAAEILCGVPGRVLLTVGSKELPAFAKIPDAADRLYARVLPMESSLAACSACGLPPAHIIAMQGPFSEELNTALLKSTGASWLVTKDGGDPGGFADKAAAVKKTGGRLLIIGRPPQREGLSYPEMVQQLTSRFGLRSRPEVAVVGIGPGSMAAMTGEVRAAIEEADCLIGAERMLSCAGSRPAYPAIAPDRIAAVIREHPEYSRFTVVMSGDTGFFSGTRKLLPLLSDCSVRVLPGISSLSCLCARLGVSYEDVRVFSLHGRSASILPVIRSHARVFTLVGGDDGVSSLCADLTDAGYGDARVSVGSRLSYPDEQIVSGTASQLALQKFPALSAVLIEHSHPLRSFACGLPDSAFTRNAEGERVVPMTKSEIRAISLAKLALCRDSVCWDIGAGTGSVSIEMALQAVQGHVYAVEKNEDALTLLHENIQRFGVSNITPVAGIAPDCCADLPAPTHVFIGGSSGNMKQLLKLVMNKNPSVRIVATAIALETVAELAAYLKEFPFTEADSVCVNISRSRKAGPYHLMTAQNPVYVFTMQKGGAQ